MESLMKQYRELNMKLFGMLVHYEDMTAALEQELDDLNADFEECNIRKCEAEAAFHQLAEDSDRRCADLFETARKQEDTINKQARRIDLMCSFMLSIDKILQRSLTPDDYQIAQDLFDLDRSIHGPGTAED